LIQQYLSARESYDAIFALKFFTNLFNSHIFESIIITELIAGLMGYGIAGEDSFNSIFHLLNYIVFMAFTPHIPEAVRKHFVKIYIRTLEELDKDTKQIVIYNKKLEIEYLLASTSRSYKGWEEDRIKNISNYSKLVLLAWCEECRYDQRVIIDFYEYPTRILSGVNPKIACKNCRKVNTLAYLMVPQTMISIYWDE
jgi:hypothetical protein